MGQDVWGWALAHFSLLQSSLKLQLLGIQLLPDLLQLMDGLLAGAQLLCEVRDLLCPGQIPSDHMEVVENKAGRERTKNYQGEDHGLTLEVLVLPLEGLQVLE